VVRRQELVLRIFKTLFETKSEDAGLAATSATVRGIVVTRHSAIRENAQLRVITLESSVSGSDDQQ